MYIHYIMNSHVFYLNLKWHGAVKTSFFNIAAFHTPLVSIIMLRQSFCFESFSHDFHNLSGPLKDNT